MCDIILGARSSYFVRPKASASPDPVPIISYAVGPVQRALDHTSCVPWHVMLPCQSMLISAGYLSYDTLVVSMPMFLVHGAAGESSSMCMNRSSKQPKDWVERSN